MAEYYAYQGLCLCPRGGRLPQEATPVAAPFHPLLYLVERDPLTHGALRPLPGPDALDAPEDWRRLLPAEGRTEEGCYELNTAFPRAMALLPPCWLRSRRTCGLPWWASATWGDNC